MYDREHLAKLLLDYQRMVQGAKPPTPDDKLGTRSPPLDDAPWANGACIKADVESALESLPFPMACIVFMAVSLGGSTWRGRSKNQSWREYVGDWWGLTAGEVSQVVDASLERMAAHLHRPTFEHTADEALTATVSVS